MTLKYWQGHVYAYELFFVTDLHTLPCVQLCAEMLQRRVPP
jgi:hypothetical protein